MTAEELKAKALANMERALADHAGPHATSQAKPANSSNPHTDAFYSGDDTAEYTGDIQLLAQVTLAERLANATPEEKATTAGLTPDQWIMIIGLIGEIVLKIIERRNPKPKP